MPIRWTFTFVSTGSALASSDDSTLSSFTDLLLHTCVIGSDEASSPWIPPHAPQVWPHLAYSLDLVIGPYGEQDPWMRVKALVVLVSLPFFSFSSWAGRIWVWNAYCQFPFPLFYPSEGMSWRKTEGDGRQGRSWDGKLRSDPADVLWAPASAPVYFT